MSERERSIARVLTAKEVPEGDGMVVRRVFPSPELEEFDPFLLLDEMGPVTLGPGQAKGFPDHPHRGFETVTYMLEGRFAHRDSRGHAGVIAPGDVQWMTAGDGLVHSEMPEAEFSRTGGRLHGLQLWVNLPRADKRMAPRYQEVPAAGIPTGRADGAEATVIAGEALGVHAAIDTRTPIAYVHFRLAPGARVRQAADPAWNALLYVLEGGGRAGQTPVERGQAALFARDGDDVALEAGPSGMSALFVAGKPLGEPVARWGPFVMNTRSEIQEAFDDYRAGRMGVIAR